MISLESSSESTYKIKQSRRTRLDIQHIMGIFASNTFGMAEHRSIDTNMCETTSTVMNRAFFFVINKLFSKSVNRTISGKCGACFTPYKLWHAGFYEINTCQYLAESHLTLNVFAYVVQFSRVEKCDWAVCHGSSFESLAYSSFDHISIGNLLTLVMSKLLGNKHAVFAS